LTKRKKEAKIFLAWTKNIFQEQKKRDGNVQLAQTKKIIN